MFIQVIKGRTDQPEALRAAMERWVETLAPGADGWLGLTGGVTDDGRFLVTARFASEEAARRNSGRAEQDQWWAETSKVLDDVTFHDCPDVQLLVGGGSDDAGFVQVLHGRLRDLDRFKELNAEGEQELPGARPDILGITAAYADDGTSTEVIYFTSEAQAREYERKDPPPDVRSRLGEMMSLVDGLTYYDLTEPWLLSAR